MNYIQYALDEAARLTLSGYAAAVKDGALPACDRLQAAGVEPSKDEKSGDIAATFALQTAKALRTAPQKIAAVTADRIDIAGTCFSGVSTAGPGFINFRLSDGYYADVVSSILAERQDYGKTKDKRGEKVMVEFVSANPTGPMHIGNARGGVLGDCMAEVLKWSGNSVTREFYVNDAGNQIDLFGLSLEARYIQHIKGEDSAEFPEEGYRGDDIRELAAAFAGEYGDKYLDGPQDRRVGALVRFGLSQNLKNMRSDLALYRIQYDSWFMESALHESGYMEETVALLEKSGYTYEKDGALWLKSTDFGCEKDDVLRRNNGNYTYFAADIAYHRDKFERRGFDRVINIWGADHHGHVARLKAALDAIGLDGSRRLEIVLMQLVRLVRGGEAVRMSKRTGKAITLRNLLEEVPVDAARFFFNSRAADTHLEFDLGLAVRNDSENPVYYVQYAHARIMSLLRNLSDEGVQIPEAAELTLCSTPQERALIKALARLPEEIRLSAEGRMPARLNRYILDVATLFHKFYTDCRIREAATPQLRDARICLCSAVRTVIENTLGILGVCAPDRM